MALDDAELASSRLAIDAITEIQLNCLDVMQISCYDTAGSVLLLGCTNGSINIIDMQKFPLRMKDNDLLITELYRDPNADVITAISVYLTPKTSMLRRHELRIASKEIFSIFLAL